MVICSMLPDGPKGMTSSSSTTRPVGFLSNLVSTSMDFSVRAISWTLSTMRPAFRKSVASMRYFPLTSPKRIEAISSTDFPTHLSGESIIEVSPNSVGRSGPMSTFGYPYLPTNTAGGEDPAMSLVSIFGSMRSWE